MVTQNAREPAWLDQRLHEVRLLLPEGEQTQTDTRVLDYPVEIPGEATRRTHFLCTSENLGHCGVHLRPTLSRKTPLS